jgi:NADPH:quinone reductase-like Zn-dependent oxidoreductase
MSKSMTFSWDWLGSAAYHRTNLENYHRIFRTLARYIDEGKLVPNLTRRLKLNVAGLKEAHQLVESATTVGKIALGVDEPGEGAPFA